MNCLAGFHGALEKTSGSPDWEKNAQTKMNHPAGKMLSIRAESKRCDCKSMRPPRGLLTSHCHCIRLRRSRRRRSVRPEVLSKPLWMKVWQRRARQVRLLCPLFHRLVEARTVENHLRAGPHSDSMCSPIEEWPRKALLQRVLKDGYPGFKRAHTGQSETNSSGKTLAKGLHVRLF